MEGGCVMHPYSFKVNTLMLNGILSDKSLNDIMHDKVLGAEFAAQYKATTGKSVCSSCPKDIYNAYFEMKRYLSNPLNNNNIMSTKKFVLKKDKLVSISGDDFGIHTPDEKFAEILAQFPQFAPLFDATDAEMIAKAKAKLEKTAKAEAKTEAKTTSKEGEGAEYPSNIQSLKKLAKERDIPVPAGAKAADIKALLAAYDAEKAAEGKDKANTDENNGDTN